MIKFWHVPFELRIVLCHLSLLRRIELRPLLLEHPFANLHMLFQLLCASLKGEPLAASTTSGRARTDDTHVVFFLSRALSRPERKALGCTDSEWEGPQEDTYMLFQSSAPTSKESSWQHTHTHTLSGKACKDETNAFHGSLWQPQRRAHGRTHSEGEGPQG